MMLDDERVEILELLQPGVIRPHVDHAARASWLAAVHEAMRSVGGAGWAYFVSGDGCSKRSGQTVLA